MGWYLCQVLVTMGQPCQLWEHLAEQPVLLLVSVFVWYNFWLITACFVATFDEIITFYYFVLEDSCRVCWQFWRNNKLLLLMIVFIHYYFWLLSLSDITFDRLIHVLLPLEENLIINVKLYWLLFFMATFGQVKHAGITCFFFSPILQVMMSQKLFFETSSKKKRKLHIIVITTQWFLARRLMIQALLMLLTKLEYP